MSAKGYISGWTTALGRSATASKAVRLLILVLAVLAFAYQELAVAADAPDVSETQVKAAFLINFPKYVDWPTDALAESNSPIVVAVFGETSLDGDLKKMLKGKTINGHPLVFKRVSTEEEAINGCHILFIGEESARRASTIIGKLDGTSILTVGDSDDFLDSGGVIRLARRDRKIRLEISLTAANRAHLKLSSKLLGVADVVRDGPRGGGG
jgi:hypothetical protein